MDRAEAALLVAEAALLEARKALKLATEASIIQGPKGDPGEKGDKGEDGIITQKVAAYRDVWKEATEYELGDFVTWGGSLWHCNAEKTQEKPGTSEAWTLAVKRGRDGKDGKNGEKGDPGTPGPKGPKGEIGYA